MWLTDPELWAVVWLVFFFLCPGCGLVLYLVGMLDCPVCGVWFLCGLMVLVCCGSFGGSVSG